MPGTKYVRFHYQYCLFCMHRLQNESPIVALGKRRAKVTFVENTALSRWPEGVLGPSRGGSSGQSLGDG